MLVHFRVIRAPQQDLVYKISKYADERLLYNSKIVTRSQTFQPKTFDELLFSREPKNQILPYLYRQYELMQFKHGFEHDFIFKFSKEALFSYKLEKASVPSYQNKVMSYL
jgi:hypothetical protein